MIKAALRSALSDRAAEGKILVIDEWGFAEPKTKAAVAALERARHRRSALVVVEHERHQHDQELPQPARGAADRARRAQRLRRAVQRRHRLHQGDALPTGSRPTTKAGEPLADADAADESSTTGRGSAPTGSAPAARRRLGDAGRLRRSRATTDSMLYHVPGSRFYDQTVAEICVRHRPSDAEASRRIEQPPVADAMTSRRRCDDDEEQS